jgi:hypothetical protein
MQHEVRAPPQYFVAVGTACAMFACAPVSPPRLPMLAPFCGNSRTTHVAMVDIGLIATVGSQLGVPQQECGVYMTRKACLLYCAVIVVLPATRLPCMRNVLVVFTRPMRPIRPIAATTQCTTSFCRTHSLLQPCMIMGMSGGTAWGGWDGWDSYNPRLSSKTDGRRGFGSAYHSLCKRRQCRRRSACGAAGRCIPLGARSPGMSLLARRLGPKFLGNLVWNKFHKEAVMETLLVDVYYNELDFVLRPGRSMCMVLPATFCIVVKKFEFVAAAGIVSFCARSKRTV